MVSKKNVIAIAALFAGSNQLNQVSGIQNLVSLDRAFAANEKELQKTDLKKEEPKAAPANKEQHLGHAESKTHASESIANVVLAKVDAEAMVNLSSNSDGWDDVTLGNPKGAMMGKDNKGENWEIVYQFPNVLKVKGALLQQIGQDNAKLACPVTKMDVELSMDRQIWQPLSADGKPFDTGMKEGEYDAEKVYKVNFGLMQAAKYVKFIFKQKDFFCKNEDSLPSLRADVVATNKDVFSQVFQGDYAYMDAKAKVKFSSCQSEDWCLAKLMGPNGFDESSASYYSAEPKYEIDFELPEEREVKAVDMKKRGDNKNKGKNFLKKVKVSYSQDGQSYTDYGDVVIGQTREDGPDVLRSGEIKKPFKAKFVKVTIDRDDVNDDSRFTGRIDLVLSTANAGAFDKYMW